MKIKLQTFLRHRLQWLVLLTALLGVSQGVLGWDQCRIHGQFGDEKSWVTSEELNCSKSTSFELSVGQYEFGIKSNNDQWLTIGTQTISSTVENCLFYVNGSVGNPTLNVTVAGTYTFKSKNCRNDGIEIDIIFPESKISCDDDSWNEHSISSSYTYNFTTTGTKQFVIKNVDGTYYKNVGFTRSDNSKTLTNSDISNATVEVDIPGDYTFTWNSSTKVLTITYPSHPCYSSTDISNIVNGTNVMFYFKTYSDKGWRDGYIGITNGTTDDIIGTPIKINDDIYGYVTMLSESVPTNVYVTNNGGASGDWAGNNAGAGTNAAGALYDGTASSKTNATTVAVTLSSSSVPYGTASINLTIVGSDTESSYGEMLFAQIFVDGTKVECQALATSPGSVYTLNTSSLTVGNHTIKTILTDGTIYYIGDTDVLTVTEACSSAPVIGTQPQDTEVCENGSASLTIAATITVGTPTYQWYTCNADGTGESPIGGATGSSYTLPTSTPGTYYYKCKASGCGETTDSNVATVTVDATSVAGSISALANPICSGTGTTLSIPNGNTGSITQWQYYNTASSQWTNLGTSSTQTTGNLTAATQYKAYVKNGMCDAVASSTYTVNLKTAPSKPSISGNTIMCGPSASGAYTYTSTDVSADSYSWTVTGATLYSGSGTSSITVTAGDVDDSPVTIAVTAVNCPNNTPLSTAADNFSARIFKSASAGTVNLTKNSVCVNESGITASRAGTWYSGGGTFQWSSADEDYATVSDASATSPTITAEASTSPSSVNITCTINLPTCTSASTSSSAALTIKSTPIFSITPATPSGTAWKPISLSTSPSQAGAEWSITTNHSDAADVSSVGYLSTDEGSSTVFKGPAPASSGTNTFVVQATVTDGSSNCTTTVSKNVNVDYESCE